MSCKPCCCISSRYAALLVAVVQFAASGLSVYVLFKNIESLQNPTPKDRLIRWSQGSFGDSDTDPDKIFIMMFFGPLSIVLNVLFTSMLVHGIRKNNLCLIKAHLIANVVGLVLSTASTIVNMATTNHEGFISLLMPLFVKMFIIYVVYCAYLETQEKLSPMSEASVNMFGYTHPLSGHGAGAVLYYPEPTGVHIEGAYTPKYYPHQIGASSYPQEMGRQGGESFYSQRMYSPQQGQQGSSLYSTESPPEPNPAAEGTAGAMSVIPTTLLPALTSSGGLACNIM